MWHPRGSAHAFTFCNTHRSLHHLSFALGCAQQTASAVLHMKRGKIGWKQQQGEAGSVLGSDIPNCTAEAGHLCVYICTCVMRMLAHGSTCYTYLLVAVSTNKTPNSKWLKMVVHQSIAWGNLKEDDCSRHSNSRAAWEQEGPTDYKAALPSLVSFKQDVSVLWMENLCIGHSPHWLLVNANVHSPTGLSSKTQQS